MSSGNFEELSWHVYNIAIECNDCGTVLMSFDNPNNGYLKPRQQKEAQMEGVEG